MPEEFMSWLSDPPHTLVRLMGTGGGVDEESADTVDGDAQRCAHLPHAFVAQPSQSIDKHGD
jgi:hypothetical protein